MPAPTDVTVQTVVKREEWTGNDGTQMVTYEIVLEGEGQVRKAVKPLSKDPKPESGPAKAWIDTPGKISFADPNFTPRGGGGSGGGQSNYERQPDHPLTVGQKLTTSTLSPVPKFIEQMLTLSLVDTPKTIDAYWTLVELTVDKLKKFYPDDVIARAEGSTNGAAQEIPSADPAGDSVPF